MARVWDRFLTEQDREHLANSKHRSVGVGRRPAVLNIDLYRAVFGDEKLPLVEGIKHWPSYCGPAAWEAVPHIQRLMKKAREIGVPVLHVTGLSEEESGVPGWSDAIHPGARKGVSSDPAAQARYARRLEIIDEVGPEPGEVVLKKTAPSAFWGTPLMAQLNLLHVDTLLITGESVSGCVRASVVEAASYRFKVQVVEECVFDRHESCRAINLFDMNQKYADVISIDAAMAYLEKLQGAADVRQSELVKG
ncbi:MAG TPA: isochorismatase family protein [Beijerinckiaceae bacterium]|jgi:nicotinamidase-related amidase|nr:isochorismatase family protein [Beijerinckiaceae bacterium]